MRTLRFTADKDCTLYELLHLREGISVTVIRRLKKLPGSALVNSVPAKMPDRVKPGDEVLIRLPTGKCTAVANRGLFAKIAYEDEDVIVFNKPCDMPVHPSARHRDNTLANFFAAYCGQNGISCAFRPINRLDRNTTGLCAAAKSTFAAFSLSKTLKKEYTAICAGVLENDCGTINAPIAREGESIIKREVRADGQAAVTHYTVVKRLAEATVVKLRLETGRTHQIRVHFAYIGHPLLGDELYGGDMRWIDRHALHCSKLRFVHPITKAVVEIESELPDDMKAVVHSEAD